MRPHKYTRVRNVIMDARTNKKRTKYDSINEAKRKSRELQMQEDGALGRGSVRRAA